MPYQWKVIATSKNLHTLVRRPVHDRGNLVIARQDDDRHDLDELDAEVARILTARRSQEAPTPRGNDNLAIGG